MAASKQYDSKDLTQCGICFLTLQDPIALPCLHSFCLKCLSQWAKGKTKVTCPLCIQEFEIPSGGVRAFRTNVFINTLKEREENAKTIQSKTAVAPCASCAAIESKIEGHCSSCGGFICGDCFEVHSKHSTMKSLSNHKAIPYTDLQSGKVDIGKLHKKKYCKVHEEQVLRVFCKTCGELVCLSCTVVDHHGASHKLVNLENATKEQKSEIEQLVRGCEEFKKKIEDVLQEVDSVLEKLDRNATTAEEEIDKAFNKALRLLEDTRNRLKGEVKTIVSERKKQITTEKDKIQLQKTRLVTTLPMATEVVQTGSDYDLALIYSYLKTNLTILRDMKPACSMQKLGNINFKTARTNQQATQTLGSISSCCRRAKVGVGVWKKDRAFGTIPGTVLGGRGVAINKQDDIVIADYSDQSIKFYNTNGHFKSRIKIPNMPWNITVSQDGRMFVTDWTKHVSIYDVEGNLKQQFPAKSPKKKSSDKQNTKLFSQVIDNHNNLLVGEATQKYISKHRLDGRHVMSFKVTIEPRYIAVSSQDKVIVSSIIDNTVHILEKNGTHIHTLKTPRGLSLWNPAGVCCTSDDEVYIANYDSPGSIHSYSTETGDYIGCLTKDVTNPADLALTDDENKLIVAENNGVNIFQLQ